MATDTELLAAWQAGDRDAGGALIDRYFDPVRRFFESKLSEGVEDLIQQTFLACVRRRDAIRDPEAFRGYLFAAARTKLYDHLSSRKRAQDAIDFGVSSVIDLGESPSGAIAARHDQRLLVQALRHLPLDLQIALELYYVERVRGQQLVVALDIPPGTVRSRLRRGLELLRRHFDQLAATPELVRETSTDLDRWAADLRDDPDDATS